MEPAVLAKTVHIALEGMDRTLSLKPGRKNLPRPSWVRPEGRSSMARRGKHMPFLKSSVTSANNSPGLPPSRHFPTTSLPLTSSQPLLR